MIIQTAETPDDSVLPLLAGPVQADDDLPPSERLTPRETGAHERAKLFRIQAKILAERLDGITVEATRLGTTDIPRGVDARRLAARARCMMESFETWERGEATHEQRVDDHTGWLTLQSDARQLEMNVPPRKVTTSSTRTRGS
jgi:hypothetical protein